MNLDQAETCNIIIKLFNKLFIIGLIDLFVISVNRDDLILFIDTFKLIIVTYIAFGEWVCALFYLE